jgi:desumoylating isopeptidase 1
MFGVYRGGVTRDVLVPGLLSEDAAVRTSAASLAFNVAGWMQRGRVGREEGGGGEGVREDEEDGEWEVEMVSAVVEAIERETNSEDVGGWTLSFCLSL